ncbi:hypothetical protein SETIT_3G022800v2 [Setaria italica]|uniref:Uncharacterized protein n=1 Tax=Setaria italica TaxID=4555 RepID=A0A368QAF7_SETIT|nr:hypothetical protein SETIT_3G022800v2 [Setaria italica]
MEGAAAQMAVPVLGIIAAAAVTFYTVSFMQLRDKSFEELDEKYSEFDDESGGSASDVLKWLYEYVCTILALFLCSSRSCKIICHFICKRWYTFLCTPWILTCV